MKVVIIGGHLSPALSVAGSLPKHTNVLYLGRKYVFEGNKTLSLEYITVRKLKIPFFSITTGRLQRKFTKYTISSVLKLPIGFIQSVRILIKYKPDIVVGFGSYVEVPVIMASFILGIPAVLHEQTFGAGLANRICSRFAKKICISWEESRSFFPKNKTVFTGSPIKTTQNSKLTTQNSKEGLTLIYVTGGSSGSHFINLLVEGCIEKLLEKFTVIHQTGDARQYKDFERLKNLSVKLRGKVGNKYIVKKFISPDETGEVLRNADIVVSRGGINTVLELAYLRKPALLIPLPFSQSDEQIKNSLFLKNLGLAEILYQEKTDSLIFFKTLTLMFKNIEKYKKNLAKFTIEDGSENIVEVIESCAKRG